MVMKTVQLFDNRGMPLLITNTMDRETFDELYPTWHTAIVTSSFAGTKAGAPVVAERLHEIVIRGVLNQPKIFNYGDN